MSAVVVQRSKENSEYVRLGIGSKDQGNNTINLSYEAGCKTQEEILLTPPQNTGRLRDLAPGRYGPAIRSVAKVQDFGPVRLGGSVDISHSSPCD
jgi:hypothetical protein